MRNNVHLVFFHEDREASLSNVKKALDEGVSPIEIINKGLMKGIDAVSLLYTKGFYFLPDLMNIVSNLDVRVFNFFTS